MLLLLSPRSLCPLHTTGQWLRETRGWNKKETWIREPADQGDGRLLPQNSHLVRAWTPGSFMDQRWRLRGPREVRKQNKKTIQPRQMSPRMASVTEGCVSFTSLQSFTRGLIRWSPWGRPLWAFIITKKSLSHRSRSGVNLKLTKKKRNRKKKKSPLPSYMMMSWHSKTNLSGCLP